MRLIIGRRGRAAVLLVLSLSKGPRWHFSQRTADHGQLTMDLSCLKPQVERRRNDPPTCQRQVNLQRTKGAQPYAEGGTPGSI